MQQNALQVLENLRLRHFWTHREAELTRHLSRLLNQTEDGALAPSPHRFSSLGESRGLVVTGPSGAGKSNALQYCFNKITKNWEQSEDRRPFVKIDVPSLDSLKDLGIATIKETGYYEVSTKRERWSIWDFVRYRFGLVGTAVYWLDEAHDIFRHGETKWILKALKNLMAGPNAVVVVLSGTCRLRDDLAADGEIRRRFRAYEIPPVNPITERELLERALATYAAAVGIEYPDEADILDRLLHGIDNRLGRAIEIMLDALGIAIEAGDQKLDRQHFAEGWATHLECPKGANVFVVENWPDVEPVRDSPQNLLIPPKRGKRKSSSS